MYEVNLPRTFADEPNEVKTAWPNSTYEFTGIAGCASHITAEPSKVDEILKAIDIDAVNAAWDRKPDFPDQLKSCLRAYTTVQ